MKSHNKKKITLIAAIVIAAVLIVWVVLTQLKPGVPTIPGAVSQKSAVEVGTAGE